MSRAIRKNAAINLLEAGCTEAQVGSIVNMSERMGAAMSRGKPADAGARGNEAAGKPLGGASAGGPCRRTRTELELKTNGSNWKPALVGSLKAAEKRGGFGV